MVCKCLWREMEGQQGSRIDLAELKTHIVKKIGVEKSRKYLNYLSRFLNQKLAKSELDKWCFRLLGRENLPLHNQLIRSILKNACQAKNPPPIHEAGPVKSLGQTIKSSATDDGPEHCGFLVPHQNQSVPILSNGVLCVSPRKVRSVMRDRKFRDRCSLPGPNGKVKYLSHQQMGAEDNGGKVSMENGDLGHRDYQRLAHFDDGRDNLVLRPGKKPRIPNKDRGETNAIEEEEQARLNFSKTPLLAPLGIPFCSPSVGGSRKIAVSTGSDFISCYGTGELYDSEMLRKRMENIAAVQGLGGVSGECANTLNNMLDVYLKRLIKSCIDLVGAKSNGPRKQTVDKQQIRGKIMNGMWPGNNSHMQNTGGLSDVTQDQSPDQLAVSLLDFRVAMELNPQQLGEDWALLLERICTRSFEE